jgi:hypothetical protein
MPGFDIYQKELENLGKFKTSISCLYVKRLSDINIDILKEMIKDSVQKMKIQYSVK